MRIIQIWVTFFQLSDVDVLIGLWNNIFKLLIKNKNNITAAKIIKVMHIAFTLKG